MKHPKISSTFLNLSLGLVLMGLSACSTRDRKQYYGISVQVPKEWANAKSSFKPTKKSSFSKPADISSFHCYAVNVIGSGISPDPRLKCTNPDSGMGQIAGFVPVTTTSIDLLVPAGPTRTIQLIGIQSAIGCPRLNDLLNAPGSNDTKFKAFGEPYLLGSAVLDIFDDATVDITVSYDQATAQKAFQGCDSEGGDRNDNPQIAFNVINNSPVIQKGHCSPVDLSIHNLNIDFSSSTNTQTNFQVEPSLVLPRVKPVIVSYTSDPDYTDTNTQTETNTNIVTTSYVTTTFTDSGTGTYTSTRTEHYPPTTTTVTTVGTHVASVSEGSTIVVSLDVPGCARLQVVSTNGVDSSSIVYSGCSVSFNLPWPMIYSHLAYNFFFTMRNSADQVIIPETVGLLPADENHSVAVFIDDVHLADKTFTDTHYYPYTYTNTAVVTSTGTGTYTYEAGYTGTHYETSTGTVTDTYYYYDSYAGTYVDTTEPAATPAPTLPPPAPSTTKFYSDPYCYYERNKDDYLYFMYGSNIRFYVRSYDLSFELKAELAEGGEQITAEAEPTPSPSPSPIPISTFETPSQIFITANDRFESYGVDFSWTSTHTGLGIDTVRFTDTTYTTYTQTETGTVTYSYVYSNTGTYTDYGNWESDPVEYRFDYTGTATHTSTDTGEYVHDNPYPVVLTNTYVNVDTNPLAMKHEVPVNTCVPIVLQRYNDPSGPNWWTRLENEFGYFNLEVHRNSYESSSSPMPPMLQGPTGTETETNTETEEEPVPSVSLYSDANCNNLIIPDGSGPGSQSYYLEPGVFDYYLTDQVTLWVKNPKTESIHFGISSDDDSAEPTAITYDFAEIPLHLTYPMYGEGQTLLIEKNKLVEVWPEYQYLSNCWIDLETKPLPPGLSFDSYTCTFFGKATTVTDPYVYTINADYYGYFDVKLQVVDAFPLFDARVKWDEDEFTIPNGWPVNITLAEPTSGCNLSEWSDRLPSGLTLNPENCTITGAITGYISEYAEIELTWDTEDGTQYIYFYIYSGQPYGNIVPTDLSFDSSMYAQACANSGGACSYDSTNKTYTFVQDSYFELYPDYSGEDGINYCESNPSFPEGTYLSSWDCGLSGSFSQVSEPREHTLTVWPYNEYSLPVTTTFKVAVVSSLPPPPQLPENAEGRWILRELKCDGTPVANLPPIFLSLNLGDSTANLEQGVSETCFEGHTSNLSFGAETITFASTEKTCNGVCDTNVCTPGSESFSSDFHYNFDGNFLNLNNYEGTTQECPANTLDASFRFEKEQPPQLTPYSMNFVPLTTSNFFTIDPSWDLTLTLDSYFVPVGDCTITPPLPQGLRLEGCTIRGTPIGGASGPTKYFLSGTNDFPLWEENQLPVYNFAFDLWLAVGTPPTQPSDLSKYDNRYGDVSTPQEYTVIQGQAFSISPVRPLSYCYKDPMSGYAPWVNFDSNTCTLSGVPSPPGNYDVKLETQEGGNFNRKILIKITVVADPN